MEEIVPIAGQIPHVWKEVAYLTKQFETYEIEDLRFSRVNEDKTHKARTMLIRYIEQAGTGQRLAKAIEKIKLVSLSQDVLSGYFIDTGEEE